MRRIRPAVLALLMTGGLVVGVGGPVAAAPATSSASSICAVTADNVMGTSETVIGIRVRAFDCSGDALPFHGSVTVAPIIDSTAWPWTYGRSAEPAPVASTDGAPEIGLVDISTLPTGFGRVVYDLTADGDADAFVQPASDTNDPVLLTRDPMWAGSAWTDLTHTGSPVAYSFMLHERELWGCDTVLNIDAACVLSARTSSDQTWQKGFKLTLSWPDPGLDASGRPYQRCRVRSGVVLTATMPGPTGAVSSSTFPVSIDVPATWTDYTLPLGDDIRFPSWVTPGASTLDVSYWCYSNRGTGTGTDWTGLKTVDRVLVPDLPPTEPTSVQVAAADGAAVVTPSGSVALGAAPMLGYDIAAIDEGGEVLVTERVPALTVTPMAVRRASIVGAPASGHRFADLKPGRYTFRVSAFNSVGSSDPVMSSVVTVTARATTPVSPARPRLTAPRHVKAAVAHRRLVVSWSKPSSVGGGVVRYRIAIHRGGRLVQQASLRSSAHEFRSKRLSAEGRYRVTVTAVAKDGRTMSTARTVGVHR